MLEKWQFDYLNTICVQNLPQLFPKARLNMSQISGSALGDKVPLSDAFHDKNDRVRPRA